MAGCGELPVAGWTGRRETIIFCCKPLADRRWKAKSIRQYRINVINKSCFPPNRSTGQRKVQRSHVSSFSPITLAKSVPNALLCGEKHADGNPHS